MLRSWDDLPQEMQNEEVRKYYDILQKKKSGMFFKRLFDIVVSAIMLIVFSPLFAILIIAIKIDSPGPAFFRQERVTQYNRLFRIFKFRTMVLNAEQMGSQVTVHNDMRITRVGRLIRKCRLDEVSQLIDVLRGTMTFVGTRPEVVKYVNRYTPEMMATLLLPAGVTSQASIFYKDEDKILKDADDVDDLYVEKVLPGKMRFNLSAIENFSFWRDMLTIVRTVLAMFGKNYQEDDIKKGDIVENIEEPSCITDKLISIITPTYNCADFISRTIESVQAQTYSNWEMIIVDDRSKDNTGEIVAGYMKNDNRIQYHLLEENSGAAVARTIAMQLAEGSFMAFLDSDDIWLPEKLQRQMDFMKENDYSLSCTAYEQIDEEDKPIGKTVKTIKKTDYNRLLLDCPVGNSTVMYNVEKMGKFEVPNIRKRNDDALWLQMLKKEKYMWGMPDVLMLYRIRQNSISSNKMQLIKYHWILYRDIEHLSIPRSIFHIGFWCIIKILKIK